MHSRVVQTGSHSEMEFEKFGTSAKSGYNKGTIRADIRYLVVSIDVRRHRLVSIDYIKTLCCHGRGHQFESRRPHVVLPISPLFFGSLFPICSQSVPDLFPVHFPTKLWLIHRGLLPCFLLGIVSRTAEFPTCFLLLFLCAYPRLSTKKFRARIA